MAYLHQINLKDNQNTFGQGYVTSVYFNFCSFHCPQCWNQSTWERKDELYWDNDKVVDTVVDALNNELINRGFKPNLSLLGGDPIVNENVEDTLYILTKVRERVPNVRVAVWTGFDIEDWYRKPTEHEKQFKILPMIDYLIDGRFVYRAKTEHQMFGSVNQRVIDVKSLLSKKDVTSENIKYVLQNCVENKEFKILELKKPNLTFSTKELMDYYVRPQSKDRTYQIAVLHYISYLQKYYNMLKTTDDINTYLSAQDIIKSIRGDYSQ